ncbi:MAG: ATP-binding protein [Firmicutes bacterium]|nr:ATP-binding protein [Bacillota bacterium]
MDNKILAACVGLESLTVLRGLLTDPIVSKFLRLLQNQLLDQPTTLLWVNDYADFYYTLLEKNGGSTYADYLIERLLFTDTVFSRACEKQELEEVRASVMEAMIHDLHCLSDVAALTASDLKVSALRHLDQSSYVYEKIKALPEWETAITYNGHRKGEELYACLQVAKNWGECVPQLADFYRQHGSGAFACYTGFTWESVGQNGQLTGIATVDGIRFSDLIGYELERQKVVDNTLTFIKGYPANNILLYGDRGTGKSTTVKALLNEYSSLGLRVVELPQAQLMDLHSVLHVLKERAQKFIIFVDDLAFDDNEERYTALKAVLEGGLEQKPQNVVIYATSNRRHLIKEKFSERSGLQSGYGNDEVRATDTLQEKLSLADRFGITVTFLSPDQRKYLDIVEGLAKNRELKIDSTRLRAEAVKWEMWQNGRSPRTARQFIDWLEGQMDRS